MSLETLRSLPSESGKTSEPKTLSILRTWQRQGRGIHISVLVQREMERSRFPLAMSIPPYGRGFSRHQGLSIR